MAPFWSTGEWVPSPPAQRVGVCLEEQNEQKILEELSHLFKDHLDLLADFRSIVRR